MKRIAFLLLGAAVLMLPSQALAKEPLSAVQICGLDDCNSTSGPGNMDGFSGGYGGDYLAVSQGPAPYYTVRFTAGSGPGWQVFYVPSAKMLSSGDEQGELQWMPAPAAALDRLAGDLKPFPKPEITEVLIGSKRVTEDPASYLRLYTVKPAGEAVLTGLPDWEPITFRGDRESPWTKWDPGLYFSAQSGTMMRGGEIVKLPAGMAASVRAGESLSSGSGFPWRMVIIALLGGVALIAAAGAIRPLRRRAFLRKQPTPA